MVKIFFFLVIFFILFLVILFISFYVRNSRNKYESHNEKSLKQAKNYNNTKQLPIRYLAYRDIPNILSKYVKGKKALDYGAGTGISTNFLLSQNFDVTGADISKEMLKQAKINIPNVTFYLISNNLLPFSNKTFDLVFSSFVLFEIGRKNDLINYLKEAKRVMKPNGTFIGITGNINLYTKNLFICDNTFPSNKNLKSGDKAKIFIPDVNMEFSDFLWTKNDYLECFEKAGLKIINLHEPIGKNTDPFPWRDEKIISPFFIFAAKTRKI